MKKFLLLILSLTLFVSCGEKEAPITPPDEPTEEPTLPKEYTVSLGMIGDITIENSPMGKASPNDLYGVQVWSKAATGTNDYIQCAYGLFDDKTQMTIKLLEGYLYKFQTTMVVDGKNIINSHVVDSEIVYSWPFILAGDNRANSTCKNIFVWSQKNYMYYISGGETTIIGGTALTSNYDRPFTDRYYGEVAGYAPSENGSVSIDMKRVVFEVKFIAEDLTEGKLLISMEGSPELTIENGSTEISKITTFKNPDYYSNSSAWTQDGYTEDVPVSIIWEKADGATIPLVNRTLTFTRKQLSTITIKVKDTSVSNGMSITEETGGIIAGENIIINSGDGIDTPVNPGS